MKNSLIIVESPTKVRTLLTFLPKDYEIISSSGHIRDIAKTGKYNLGFDLDKFIPDYEIIKDKEKIIKDLITKSKKAKTIYLATDPDREGEAISNDIKEIIKDEIASDTPIFRIKFNEITKQAILAALDNKDDINASLVKSQLVRRLLDRLIGFLLSKFLQKKIKSKSAGRVQSVALKQVADLQKKIDDFVPEKYYLIKVEVANDLWFDLKTYKSKKIIVKNEDTLNLLKSDVKSEPLYVNDVSKDIITKEVKQSPKVPFKTTTLIQTASSALGFTTKRTQIVAQSLYEGVKINDKFTSLISYIRTDSTRLSNYFIEHGLDFVKNNYQEYCINKYINRGTAKKQKVKIQDAHEAIRIINFEMAPDTIEQYLTKDQYALYKLIYFHTLACFLKPPILLKKQVTLHLNDFGFLRNDYQLKYLGYWTVLGTDKNLINDHKSTFDYDFTNWKQKVLTFNADEKITKPPALFTETTLIKKMDNLGIGRPSTYGRIIERNILSGYFAILDKKITLTSRGLLTNQTLQVFNKLINEQFTAEVEEKLDAIAAGNSEHLEFLKLYSDMLLKLLKEAETIVEKHEGFKTETKCPICHKYNLVESSGRYGAYLRCENYKECKYRQSLKKQTLREDLQKFNALELSCFKCNLGTLVIRQNKRNVKQHFIGCNNYPKCNFIISLSPDLTEIMKTSNYEALRIIQAIENAYYQMPQDKLLEIKCPECDGDLVEKISRYKTKFIGCNNYPKCRFISPFSVKIKKKTK